MASDTSTIDTQNAKAAFSVKKLGILTIRGSVRDFTGEITFDPAALGQASFKVRVSPSTIDTGNSKRDEHLKSEDFFFVNQHPTICFQSTSVAAINNGYTATGNLTLLGVEKEVTLPFSFSEGVFSGQFTINRLDFKLGEKFPAFIVGKTIQISISCKIKSL